MGFLLRRLRMTEVPQGEHATFSFLDFITLALVLDAIPDFTHGKVLGGFVCLWLAYANHAIGVRWQISRYLIPPAALTLFVCAFVWCIDIKDTEMKYLAAGFVGAVILIAAVAAYSWIGKKESPPEVVGGPQLFLRLTLLRRQLKLQLHQNSNQFQSLNPNLRVSGRKLRRWTTRKWQQGRGKRDCYTHSPTPKEERALWAIVQLLK